jgi:class 3 adenylate cyclase/tetratricopeptide (TPR) repeat protein
MKCSKCRHANREGAKFCKKCGNKLELICPSCGHPYQADSTFCDECGHDLQKPSEPPPIDLNKPHSYTPKHLADKILTTRSSIQGERKLVTVLFADVANFTTISEKLDPEEVHQIMDGCFKILMDEIHRYEGTINQFTGDGVMALFGAPVAHEEHARMACQAAVATQRAMGEYEEKIGKEYGVAFKMRMGLNSGLVVVGSIGDDLRMDYTAVGDTTNLASRMESHAQPGHILVSGHTYAHSKAYFEFEALGRLAIKGKEAPQEAYELVRAGGVETRIGASVARGLTKFVGRTREQEALKEACEKAGSGGGQVVGIVGEAGVGKSRLLLEFRAGLSEDQNTYLEGRCVQYGSAMAYLPILGILRSYFDIKDGEPETTVNQRMKEKILHFDENLKHLILPFQEILSLKVENKDYLQIDSQQRKMMAFDAVRDLFVRESHNKPLVLVIEDLHWIDKTSEKLLDHLIGSLPNTRILLILLYRPEYTHPWENHSFYGRIGLDQLSAHTSMALVQAILQGGEVAPDLREVVLTRSGGNPLFVEELTQSLLENGTIERRDDQYVLTGKASDIQVPDTIQGIIAARIDRVDEGVKRIMQVASVIGREFAFRILQTIMGMREGMKEDLRSSLLNLQGLEFISQKQLFPELEYLFKHALTQEVAYNSLLLKRRKDIHEKIGTAIETLYPENLEEYYELLAYHYVRSDNPDKALAYLDLANQKAARFNAMEEALAYFEEAMKLLDSLPETQANQERRISLVVNQIMVFKLHFKVVEYYALLNRYEPMAMGLGNQGLLGAYYNRKADCEWWFGKLDEGIQTITKAIELCRASGNIEDLGYAYHGLAWFYVHQGNFDPVFAFKKEAIPVLERAFNLRWYVWTFCVAGFAYINLGRWDEALEEDQKALSVAEKYADNSLISFANFSISWLYISKGDLTRAVECGELAVQKAPTPVDQMWAQSVLAWAWCRAGEPGRGVEVLAQIVMMLQASRFVLGEIWTRVWLGEGYFLAGEYEKAHQTLKECVELAEQCGTKFYMGQATRLLGEIELKTKPDQAGACFEKSIAIFREIKAENELALAYAGYGRLHKQLGDMARAQGYLNQALEIFERLGTLMEPDKVKEELAWLD